MGSRSDNPPLVEHDDALGVGNARHPLRDHDFRAVRSILLERSAQPEVGRRVQRRERIVEQEYLCLLYTSRCV